ncbi:SDR family NAD(P)-dependent oxidoreductase [Microbacterium gorillae]|uniref:SDR family NAD(P)-dependent oxidoreductase n=1 Tax=Microbacterium gorillae TaxID=1231063 RepID=UPI00058F450C|nr:SDR family oxidoreductase [Microbacterium gorillae]
MARLDGKVAFVTGAAGGIGSATVARLLEEGARVAAADLDPDRVAEVLGDAPYDPDRLVAIRCDVADAAQVESAIAQALETFGRLDILCNIAGGSSTNDGRVTEAPVEEFWRVLGVDLFGTFAVSKYGIPALIAVGGGSVVNLTSVAAIAPLPDRNCYAAAKGGVVSLTRAMAYDYGADGIRVNAIAPGTTLTPRVAAYSHTDEAKRLAARHLVGELDPVDVANAIVFLASDEARKITGQILPVDGGLTIS